MPRVAPVGASVPDVALNCHFFELPKFEFEPNY